MKNYGHIAHLLGSRIGPGDHMCEAGQARIATLKARDRHDHIIAQEKLDGTNVGAARLTACSKGNVIWTSQIVPSDSVRKDSELRSS